MTELMPHDNAPVEAKHFDIELDDHPGTAPPVYVDTVDKQPIQIPLIPSQFRTWDSTKRWAKAVSYRTAYRAGAHAIRSPWYLTQSMWWGCWGLLVLIGRHIRWVWHPELASMLQEAANKADLERGPGIERQLASRRTNRLAILGAELVAVAVVAIVLFVAVPRWILLAAVLGVMLILARFGRPADKPIISAAIVVPRHRRINPDVVVYAYNRAGLGKADKPDEQITFASKMAEDNTATGTQVLIDLPHGITFSEVVAKREKLASGLDVALSQVDLTLDKSSNRRHQLWIGYVDPLSIPAGRTPLLDCKPRDIWRAVPLGLDKRARRVMLPLMFTSILVGAQPRKGKTFTARAIALFAALDPYVRLSVFDGKGSPDWRNFALVAYTYGFGLLPDRVQGDPLENLRSTLRAAKQDILQRNAKLSELPSSICPEGKLTRDIARDPRFGMPVWVIVLDEFQEYLNTGDTEFDEEIAELLVFGVKVGPSVGVIFLSSTQKPSGLGSTGKVAKRFTDYRDNHLTRFALKTGSWQVSDAVLGSGAYSEGYDASALPVGDGSDGGPDYRGIGILYDAPVPNATVRTYFADGQDAEKILQAARRYRERAGTLDGMAAGAEVAAQARDPLTDAIDAFRGDETFLSWGTLAGRLAEQQPERYAKTSGEALSKTLRELKLGIESKTGAEKDRPGERPRGVYLANLRRALETRNTKDSR
jgi:hypothetical protein